MGWNIRWNLSQHRGDASQLIFGDARPIIEGETYN